LALAFGVAFALLVTLLMALTLYVIGEGCSQGMAHLKARLLRGKTDGYLESK
jgi:hypothetical protein